jgi:hypothetical protein
LMAFRCTDVGGYPPARMSLGGLEAPDGTCFSL